MDKYEIILYWSKDDKVFIAEVPELPGCVAHGDTLVARYRTGIRRPDSCPKGSASDVCMTT